MTLGPLMQISPRSPSGTNSLGFVTLANLIVAPGTGIPHDPGLRIPRIGLNVPEGDVSVIPQPSLSSQPVTALNRSCTSSGSGAPPDAVYFIEVQSSSDNSGYASSAVNMVGTPMKIVIFLAERSFATASRSKRVCSTISAPSRMQSSMHAVSE